ncbi:hypothetical protein [Fodinibius saliphilus]|uniref:hypothetical protein n=1 Tax=Fodinibius saliphilus TaxID=1920650 RepID=UPI001107C33E|nr:hypothetical protein [Fodinibius saliphilus]
MEYVTLSEMCFGLRSDQKTVETEPVCLRRQTLTDDTHFFFRELTLYYSINNISPVHSRPLTPYLSTMARPVHNQQPLSIRDGFELQGIRSGAILWAQSGDGP